MTPNPSTVDAEHIRLPTRACTLAKGSRGRASSQNGYVPAWPVNPPRSFDFSCGTDVEVTSSAQCNSRATAAIRVKTQPRGAAFVASEIMFASVIAPLRALLCTIVTFSGDAVLLVGMPTKIRMEGCMHCMGRQVEVPVRQVRRVLESSFRASC